MSSTNCEKQIKKARLLCVDDDLRFLALFTAVLEAAGYHVVATTEAGKALELATSVAFDIAILDYDMPRMNGAELACRLKQRRCDLPIVLFSGQPSLPAEALKIVDEHAVKGESPELLLQILRQRLCPFTPVSGDTQDSSEVTGDGHVGHFQIGACN